MNEASGKNVDIDFQLMI